MTLKQIVGGEGTGGERGILSSLLIEKYFKVLNRYSTTQVMSSLSP